MGTFNAFYVRATGNDDAMVAAIRSKFPAEEIEADTPYWGVQLSENDYKPDEGALSDLSGRLKTDVIWLGFQSAVDAFQFHHWQNGKHLRALVYGCFEGERTWERVDGQPEPWEDEIVFDQKRVTSQLKFLEGASQKRELERIYQESKISPGQTEPSLNARRCARKIAEHYSFPGWE